MAKINGTNILLYCNGKAVAMQTGLSAEITDNIIPASNKESGGWEEGIPGLKNATINLKSLFSTGLLTDTPAVLGAKDLAAYLISRSELLFAILDTGYPIIGKMLQNSLSFEAPMEGAMACSGSFKVNGKMYLLKDSAANLITDPDGNSYDYDTLTVSGLSITSAVKSTAGAKVCDSNTISVVDTLTYKLAIFLTLNSGVAPTVGIWDNTSAYISNTQLLVAGLNFITLTATASDASASLRFTNTANGNWSTSPIYLFNS